MCSQLEWHFTAILLSVLTIICSSMSSYRSALSSLYKVNAFHPVKLGLDNMHSLNRILDYPLRGVPIVHVAGTNGKGSVSVKLARSFRTVGLRAGLFTSPHISSFRERIQVDNEPLSENDVIEMIPMLLDKCNQHAVNATFFELTTAIALLKFRNSRCDVVVLEAGIGGRLDATNIFTAPDMALSVITSVQLDHQKILGETIAEIAREKAGVMKPGRGVLIGPDCPLEVLQMEAKRVGATCFTIDDVLFHNERRYKGQGGPGSSSGSQDKDLLCADTAAAALTLLRQQGGIFSRLPARPASAPELAEALKARPPCRFEVFPQQGASRQVDVVLDIAHNPAAVAAVAAKVRLHYPAQPVRIVLAMSADKAVEECLSHLLGVVGGDASRIHCTQAQHPRALAVSELKALLLRAAAHGTVEGSSQAPGTFNIAEAVQQAVAQAQADAEAEAGRGGGRAVVLVCGTAFMMAEARAALGVLEPRDGDLLGGDNLGRDAQENFGGSILKS